MRALWPLIAFFAIFSQAHAGLQCVTGYPTTTFRIMDNAAGFELQKIHHRGVQFMPFHNGVITPRDLPYLQKKAELLMKIGQYSTVQFDKDECVSNDLLWTCVKKGATVQLGELMVKSPLFTTKVRETSYNGYTWQVIFAEFSFIYQNHEYVINYEYTDGECIHY